MLAFGRTDKTSLVATSKLEFKHRQRESMPLIAGIVKMLNEHNLDLPFLSDWNLVFNTSYGHSMKLSFSSFVVIIAKGN